MFVDLLGGRVQFAIATPASAAPQVREGKLRALATLLPSRNALLPDAPTMEEAGMKGLSVTPWGGVFGPKGMPRETDIQIEIVDGAGNVTRFRDIPLTWH